MTLKDSALKFNAITESIAQWIKATDTNDVDVLGVPIKSAAKQLKEHADAFFGDQVAAIESHVNTTKSASSLAVNASDKSLDSYSRSIGEALKAKQYKEDAEQSEVAAGLSADVANTQAQLSTAALVETENLAIEVSEHAVAIDASKVEVALKANQVSQDAEQTASASAVAKNASDKSLDSYSRSIGEALKAKQYKEDAEQSEVAAGLSADVANTQAQLSTAALVETENLAIQVSEHAVAVDANKAEVATNANQARTDAAKATLAKSVAETSANMSDVTHKQTALLAESVKTDKLKTDDNSASANIDAQVASAQATLATAANQQTEQAANKAANSAVSANQAHILTVEQGAKNSQNLNQANTINKRAIELSELADLNSKTSAAQASLLALLAVVVDQNSTDAKASKNTAISMADYADQMRIHAKTHAEDAQKTREGLDVIAQGFESTYEHFLSVYSNSITEVSDLKQAAEQAASLAAHVVTDYESTLEPAPGKTPLSKGDGQIDEDWINSERSFSHFVSAFSKLTIDALAQDDALETLKITVEQLANQLQSQNKSLEFKLAHFAQAPKAGNSTINIEQFSGEREPDEVHELPFLNFSERGYLAEASTTETQAEFKRTQGASGIVSTRQYQADKGFQVGHRVTDISYACLNMHDHANYKSQPGLAEIVACVNGYDVRTRHNDYRTMYPKIGNYLAREEVHAPEVPAEVLSLATGLNDDGTIDFDNTQAGYMRDVRQDNKQDCQWHLAYLEVWPEAVGEGGELADPADSFRHANDAKKLTEMFNKGRLLNASGHKNRLENLSNQQISIKYINDNGVPVTAYLQYRINTYPVADLQNRSNDNTNLTFIVGNASSHYHKLDIDLSEEQLNLIRSGVSLTFETTNDHNHSHQVEISWNGSEFIATDLHASHQHPIVVLSGDSNHVPFDFDKAVEGVIDNTNRFKLVRDLRTRQHFDSWQSMAKSRKARFECVDLAELCAKLPGIEGNGAVLTEEYTQYGLNEILDSADGSGRLNAARYNRQYRFNRGDASGRVAANRGFNDPTLFVAKTTHPKVVGGFSWMIPLELILRTPRESWNPYDLPYQDNQTLRQEESIRGAGLTVDAAFSGIHEQHFYYGMPTGVLNVQDSQTDPADTRSTAYVKDKNGIARNVRGNGIRVFDTDGQRQRFPVYTLYADHSHENTQQHWLRQTLIDLLTKSANGTLTPEDILNKL